MADRREAMGANRLTWDAEKRTWVNKRGDSGQDAKPSTVEEKALSIAQSTDKNIAKIAEALCG